MPWFKELALLGRCSRLATPGNSYEEEPVQILSPEDRAVLWHKTVEGGPEDRESLLRILAMGILDSAGSKLDLYSGYEAPMIETVELLDAGGYLGRDDLRQAFEEADESEEAAAGFFALLADYLRLTADVERLPVEERMRALELAYDWRDQVLDRPGKAEEFLSVADVAGEFGVTPQAVYKWIREKKVEARTTPGGSYRLPAAQFTRRGRLDHARVATLQRKLLQRHPEQTGDDRDLAEEIRRRRS
jgi:transposase-like protein